MRQGKEVWWRLGVGYFRSVSGPFRASTGSVALLQAGAGRRVRPGRGWLGDRGAVARARKPSAVVLLRWLGGPSGRSRWRPPYVDFTDEGSRWVIVTSALGEAAVVPTPRRGNPGREQRRDLGPQRRPRPDR